jgi:hypothetical protein
MPRRAVGDDSILGVSTLTELHAILSAVLVAVVRRISIIAVQQYTATALRGCSALAQCCANITNALAGAQGINRVKPINLIPGPRIIDPSWFLVSLRRACATLSSPSRRRSSSSQAPWGRWARTGTRSRCRRCRRLRAKPRSRSAVSSIHTGRPRSLR